MHLGPSTSPESMNNTSHLVFLVPLLNILPATHAHEPARGAVPTLGRFSLDENSDKLQLYWLQIQTNLGILVVETDFLSPEPIRSRREREARGRLVQGMYAHNLPVKLHARLWATLYGM
ncbi:hypothetical protein BC629DRAFT_1455752 [Irpex lacteus]|nr:hypothetical protein BC629DRAFT_1455752 [Irpex lacteus]